MEFIAVFHRLFDALGHGHHRQTKGDEASLTLPFATIFHFFIHRFRLIHVEYMSLNHNVNTESKIILLG